MTKETVSTSDGRMETLWLLIAVLLVFTACGYIIIHRQRSDETMPIKETQINAFEDFNTMEQGTYNDLLTAVNEILFQYQDNGKWPLIPDLADYYIPPFVQDAAWQARGSLAWQKRV